MATLTEFTHKYSKQLTIRNEIIPVGKTMENIQLSQIIENDDLLNERYYRTKLIIDEFLRDFINRCLTDTQIDGWQELADALKKDDKDLIEKKQEQIRNNIVTKFSKFNLVGTY